MKILTIIFFLLVAGGCQNEQLVFTDEQREDVKKLVAMKGAARTEMFIKCMNLAAEMPRRSDDDVAEVVSECSRQSLYMTNYLGNR